MTPQRSSNTAGPLGHVPVVDINFRANADLKAEHQAEAKRRALIHLPYPNRAIYNFRTMVQQINDRYGGKCHLMFGMRLSPSIRSSGPSSLTLFQRDH
jgi:hypothetical protein